MNKKYWIIGGVLIILSLPFVYKSYSVSLQTKKEIKIMEVKQNIKDDNNQKIQKCLSEVDEYINNIEWNRQCRLLSLTDDCRLPENIHQQLMSVRDEQRDDCYSKYQ